MSNTQQLISVADLTNIHRSLSALNEGVSGLNTQLSHVGNEVAVTQNELAVLQQAFADYEAAIRQRIVHQGYIKGIIELPTNLFYGTGIPACIIVLGKENAAARKGIFMIDASRGFIKDGNKNRLRSQDIHKIVDVFTRQSEIEKYSRLVPLDEIEKNGYNLNIVLPFPGLLDQPSKAKPCSNALYRAR